VTIPKNRGASSPVSLTILSPSTEIIDTPQAVAEAITSHPDYAESLTIRIQDIPHLANGLNYAPGVVEALRSMPGQIKVALSMSGDGRLFVRSVYSLEESLAKLGEDCSSSPIFPGLYLGLWERWDLPGL